MMSDEDDVGCHHFMKSIREYEASAHISNHIVIL